jgi:hypothetical protein
VHPDPRRAAPSMGGKGAGRSHAEHIFGTCRADVCMCPQVKPCLMINKLDRLILELRLSPVEAYQRMQAVVTHVNMIWSSFESEKFISDADAILAYEDAKDAVASQCVPWPAASLRQQQPCRAPAIETPFPRYVTRLQGLNTVPEGIISCKRAKLLRWTLHAQGSTHCLHLAAHPWFQWCTTNQPASSFSCHTLSQSTCSKSAQHGSSSSRCTPAADLACRCT